MRTITELPMVAMRGRCVLPGVVVDFDVSRDRSAKAIEAAMLHSRMIFLLNQTDPAAERPRAEDFYSWGTVCSIRQVARLPQNMIRVLVEGQYRARLTGIRQETPFYRAAVETADPFDEEGEDPSELEAMHQIISGMIEQFIQSGGRVSKEAMARLKAQEQLGDLLTRTVGSLPFSWQQQQSFLDADSLSEAYTATAAMLNNEIQVQQVKKELQVKLKSRIDQNQREYILREQIKLIREELGEENTQDEAGEFTARLEKLEADDSVKERIAKEISRFKKMSGSAAEAAVLRSYLDTVLSLPWDTQSRDSEDLARAFQILEEGHYGLKDVKERIMEFLSVRQMTGKGRSPILCLVGPPGTGKTSIARSVAEALDKKYVRVCLGGVRDEAEIRGHRRTYVGALPGCISAGLKQAGTKNPLMLLDEVDKTGRDYKGDVSAALLEVLDPEQNSHFTDHYVEIPQDLSEVLFIATANDKSQIPRPLLDRMEMIEIAGYTENEKSHIAKEHLIPKQREANGLSEKQFSISDGALGRLINNYTREAGVRGLERAISRLCRKAVRQILEEGKKKVAVTGKNLSSFLGKPRYSFLMANARDEIGIARGLAWTQVGGDTLEIEVNVMPGKGEMVLTGQLGEVMQESARAGVSYIRSVAPSFGIDADFFTKNDLHVHIPEGAVPKDGPSAGITMATAMLSAILGQPVRADLAMTGEITLRGRVLPIGGLKEKLLAARYAKIQEVLVPSENRPDIEEMDEEITDGIKVTYVSSMSEVLDSALHVR